MAKTKAGGITYGSPGTGTLGHILPLMFARATGTHMLHVPYRGGGPAMLDLLAGRTDFMILNPAGIIPNVESGRLRTLAVTSKARLPYLPNVPTMAELGYPEVFLDGWFGIVAPAGLPERLTTTIRDKFVSVLTSPDLNCRLKDQGWVVDPITSSEFRELIRSDMIRLGKLLKDAGAKSDGVGKK